ncbi:hypothetical protein Y032_0079g1270 [Ancylostoma ceylanicum]|uniref:ShKT domain-containing protein n=2 Tax=Ancylostoma ceylanicum TaxID=53326 RepID=A0A016TTG9_9BILA|nr:hypothetical protein Y032_0079g1270 [Ancylostoma ceylanicum]
MKFRLEIGIRTTAVTVAGATTYPYANMFVPYWDSTMDDNINLYSDLSSSTSMIFSSDLLGSVISGNLVDGQFANFVGTIGEVTQRALDQYPGQLFLFQAATVNTIVTQQTLNQLCFNMNQCCSPWAARGECYNNPGVMRIVCPASCGWCSPRYNLGDNCVNRASTCKQFVLAGQCSLNYQWMAENCRKECKFCALTRDQACPALGPGMAFDAPPTGSNSRCTDSSKPCCIDKLRRTCSSLPSLIKECKGTYTSPIPSPAPAPPIARDSPSYYAA